MIDVSYENLFRTIYPTLPEGWRKVVIHAAFMEDSCNLKYYIEQADGTYCEKYYGMKENMNAAIAQGKLPVEHMLTFQEVLYRINVLETCMNFCKSAPTTPDMRVLTYHYQLTDAFIQCMMLERRLGPAGDEGVKTQRDTAFANMQNVVTSCRKKFSSFAPNNPDAYRNTLGGMINTILPAWMAYRNTYVNL